ncbi:MAG: cation transporter [Alphaproteobacteria bacterium]|nr:cation transporter [Alphaproteobacteria bacterium]
MKKIYQLENLDCANCAAKIENAVREINGVTNASVSFMTQKLMIETDADIDQIMEEVKKVIRKVEPDCEIVL